MVMEVRPEQASKAKPPILVTELGIVVFLHPAINLLVFVSIIALQLSLLSYFEFPFSTVIASAEIDVIYAQRQERILIFSKYINE